MALIRDGALAGQFSGAVGPIVFARNRYGSYMRSRTTPITSTTAYALSAKAIFTAASQAWTGLTDAERQAWREFAAQVPWVNRLGQSITLTGQSMYVGNYSRMVHAGETPLTAPPLASPPEPLITAVLVVNIGAGASSLTYTGTPLAAGVSLWYEGVVLDRLSIQYVANLVRFLGISAAAAASPQDADSLIIARFGALSAGQVVTLYIRTFDSATGLVSPPLRASTTVINTA